MRIISLTVIIGFQLISCALAADPALEIFQRRVLPILQAKKPSSCTECHLSGVELHQYLRPTQEETFAALRDAKLIDVAKPDESKLLTFIRRAPEKPNLILQKVRDEELQALAAWIRAAVADPELKAARANEPVGPSVPPEVVRHARRDHVLSSFLDNLWSEVGRCAACHSPDRNQKQVKENGEQVSWIKLNDPQGTLDHLLAAELIDLKRPEKSLLLLKPTQQVQHGGGKKMIVGDRTYTQFRRFIEDLAAVKEGKYSRASELPTANAEVSQATEIWFKLEGVPEEWDQKLLQVDLHRWNEATQTWSQERWATGDRAIFGKGKLWQQHLSVTAPRESSRAAGLAKDKRLPPGKYLAKIYLDRDGKLTTQYPTTLSPDDSVAEIEVMSQWPEGYGRMTIAKFRAK